ncbi:hypothetical protein [Mesorhizobium sp. M8A.F.Ca.ET.021.01.1.1]|uniref:hypothetical protein n=1 Tax=Mesorhizobium sp. M8A.F.Ca.ET.021.01.1.1 TaxID=2496757 RepID=UPI000FC9C166|nr:hypothetical protein [Mesorhizobium sp. M8A.F.Ca.ET.021.01.1.1]RUW46793.1 hypothetical protein EOA36_24615 [Mesorhizobium sp. M8A.F.Ca.ET.021.01.1.1]
MAASEKNEQDSQEPLSRDAEEVNLEVVDDTYLDEDLIVESNNSGEIETAREALIQRCIKAGIPAELKTYQEEIFDGDKYVLVSFPNGRDKRKKSFSGLDSIRRILGINFEKYTYIGPYAAICSYELGTIEALVKSLHPVGTAGLYRRLFEIDYFSEAAQTGNMKEIVADSDNGITLNFGPVSDALSVMNRASGRDRRLSLKLINTNVKTHDKAVELLERVANSFFFEIDLIYSIPISLEKERIRPLPGRRSNLSTKRQPLSFPNHEYDSAPMSLYWYARSARGMPLLQFLAFYQILEYYFPTYSQREATRRLSVVLKNPTFRADRDADIGKLLSAIKMTRSGSFGDERGQLRATLQECLDPDTLREFVCETEEKRQFFSSRQPSLTSHKLALANKDADLRNEVSDLIYDIRCKIVHTKNEFNEEDRNILLPFSKEADLLYNYIELIQFVSKNVLISASTKISL